LKLLSVDRSSEEKEAKNIQQTNKQTDNNKKTTNCFPFVAFKTMQQYPFENIFWQVLLPSSHSITFKSEHNHNNPMNVSTLVCTVTSAPRCNNKETISL